MLFSSYVFLLLFLPITWIGFEVVRTRVGERESLAWLVAASLVYFGWWAPKYLVLLGFSLGFNYAVGLYVGSERARATRKLGLTVGVVTNLALLAWFKYANFFVDTVNALTGADLVLQKIVLPIAISFFTFQQIAYLVDAFRGLAKEYRFIDYTLFVTFFPQLIAGPIVHHGEMLPQFKDRAADRDRTADLAIGTSIFVVGLAKKVILADTLAAYADPVFTVADAGTAVSTAEAWIGILAYTAQLYFDFSGYSDMAIGIGRMFGILLPLNFHSPYRSTSVVEFWRRWHMTLSRFLRDYLYIPLGGNRKGRIRRYVNLMATMLLGGLWHGAGWNFVLWGFLHGAYLMVNHAWFGFTKRTGVLTRWQGASRRFVAMAATFVAAMIAWVPFRAVTFDGAGRVLQGLIGLGGDAVTGVSAAAAAPWIAGALLLAWFAPNTQQIFARYEPALEFRDADRWPATEPAPLPITWRPNLAWAVVIAVLLVVALAQIARGTTFIYFQF